MINREEYFDPELYKERSVIEHSFAWTDTFKTVLIRFETKEENWLTSLLIVPFLIFARKILRQLKL
ncbi:MAG TPA: hypothetical protein PLO56_04445 [Rhodothermales bacterium]|nr:hypothetical protein [Rhodothermales bacterium]